MSLANKPHIAIGYGCNLGRVFYEDKVFVCITMTRSGYTPFSTAKMAEMSDYLIDLFEKFNDIVDWTLNYPNNFSKKKKAKIKQLLKDTDCDRNTINKWLSLLFI
jgi:hypothetical protein